MGLGAGESQVSVDAARSTRLAVYRGAGKLTAKKQTIGVPQGFGSKAEKDSAPTPPRPPQFTPRLGRLANRPSDWDEMREG